MRKRKRIIKGKFHFIVLVCLNALFAPMRPQRNTNKCARIHTHKQTQTHAQQSSAVFLLLQNHLVFY